MSRTWLRSLRPSALVGEADRYLVVLDACVQVAAFVAKNDTSLNVSIVRAAAAGIVDYVDSAIIRAEVTAAMAQPKLGAMSPADVESLMDPLWSRALAVVEPADEDPVYSRAVRDPSDAGVLRTAMGASLLPSLAARRLKCIVTSNGRDFKGSNFYGWNIRSPLHFWNDLVDTQAAAATLEEEEAAG
jgi:predicted nucleic acid-binding protein